MEFMWVVKISSIIVNLFLQFSTAFETVISGQNSCGLL